MRVSVNDEFLHLPSRSTLADAVEKLRGTAEGQGVAAALDGEVIPRTEWARTVLSDGARLELVVAVQGG